MLITPLTAMLQAEVDRVMRRVGRGFAYFFLPACCRGGLKMIIWTRHVAYISALSRTLSRALNITVATVIAGQVNL